MTSKVSIFLGLLLTIISRPTHGMYTQTNPAPAGINFLGIGYAILEGNPDGGDADLGGVDPGLLVTRRILDFSYDDENLSEDGQFTIPDEIIFTPRSSCVRSTTNEVFEGTKSYQEKLSVDVGFSGSGDLLFREYSFSLSKRYEKIYEETEYNKQIFYEEREVCNNGQARYVTELVGIDKHPLGRAFVADACALPSGYSEKEYMTFIDTWGTDVVTEVDVGTRLSTRYESSQSEFVQYVIREGGSPIESGGSFGGSESSVVVDMDKFRAEMTQDTSFGEFTETIQVGGDELPEPIAIKLIGIHEVFVADYWQLMSEYVSEGLCDTDHFNNLTIKQANLYQALQGFAVWKNANPATDPTVQIPITWPAGTYSMPRTTSASGCPDSQFPWKLGSRMQDTEDVFPDNNWSRNNHLLGPYSRNYFDRQFCSKTIAEEDSYGWEWPEGQYCIMKKGECPTGLVPGWVKWDDEDLFNGNTVSGEVPDGIYDRDTVIEFCCREDGFTSNPIYLPVDDSFFLFKYNHMCQEVIGMSFAEEWFHWDGEDDILDLEDLFGGSVPHNTGRDNDHTLHYCYYFADSA